MKELIITILIINLAIAFLICRERKMREKIREKGEKEREEIRQKAKKEIEQIERETEQLQYLLDLFTNRMILYRSNPEKFHAYEEEVSKWYKKVITAIKKYLETVTLEEDEFASAQELITILEQFAKWTKGKIE